MTAALRRIRDEEAGSSLITGLLVIGALLVPLLFVVPLFARVEMAHLTAEQVARDAVRSAVQAPTADLAQAAADRARARAHGLISLSLSGDWRRGGVLRADARTTVSFGTLPGLGRIGRVMVSAHARGPIDAYRSLPGAVP
jgi:hypothetical protein